MAAEIIRPHEGVARKLYVEPVGLKALQAEIQLVLHKALAEDTGGEADDADRFDLSHTIFSCFTLWSMTWREASSLCTSSTLIPASTISTIT